MIEVGKHYVSGDRMRWVIAVANDHVIYSRGGDRHYECLVDTFRRWLKGEWDAADELLSCELALEEST